MLQHDLITVSVWTNGTMKEPPPAQCNLHSTMSACTKSYHQHSCCSLSHITCDECWQVRQRGETDVYTCVDRLTARPVDERYNCASRPQDDVSHIRSDKHDSTVVTLDNVYQASVYRTSHSFSEGSFSCNKSQ